ncbi:27243_t:CDS:10 [Gigaspora margarita]|uniref:Methionine aminopeptidase n=1 Tax=Gigaspora margarita TaxID=4874 RepID=A0ABM8VVM2_GIGMA|nr:27243_t:CDS:10 [Gigaspora margarita]
MVKVEKNGDNIKIDGIEISIKDYNERRGFYKNDEYAIREEYQKLAKEIFVLEESKQKPDGIGYYTTEEYLKEAEKTKKVNYNLYYEAEKIYKETNHEFYTYKTGGDDDEETIKKSVEHNNEKIKKFLEYFKKILPKLRQVFTQKEETEELGKRAKKIESYRNKVKGEIEAELNKDPKITNEDLEKKEIDDIKKRVLADIESKRNAKKGKRKRDQEEDIPSPEQPDSKKPKLDDGDKSGYEDLKNKTLDQIDKNQLAAGIKVLIRMEGEKEYKDTIDEKMKPSEDELIKKDPDLYKETNLIDNKITDANEVKRVKEKAIKAIGEAAEEIIQKSKKNLTEKIKKDIKTIQEQLKSFKSGANSYLMSFYQKDKPKIDKLEKDLANSVANQTGSPQKTPRDISDSDCGGAGKYIRGNGSYMRFYLDDYVPYKNGNRKFIDFKCTFFSRPVVAHYFEGEYVKIDIERTRYENSGYEFDFLSDVIKAVKEGSSGSTSETAANLGEIGEAIEARQNFIASIEQTGQAVSNILKRLKKEIKVGVSGQDLDKLARQLMAEEKVQSSSLDYKGFTAAICVALNEELTHGIPDERVFKEGDLVSIDVACNYQGYHADAALTTIVGEGNEMKRNLLKVTKNSLYYAIQNIRPNITTTQDIGAMLEKYIRTRGYYPIKEYGGHGIGEKLHQEPFIPNYKTPNKGEIIKEGMFICIEPLVQIGDAETNKEFFSVRGKVIELINRKQFRVECDNGKIIMADVATRFRNEYGRRRAKIVVGERVIVEIVLGDLEKGQIVSFEKKV